MKKTFSTDQRGFTLVEMIVAVALFSVVMLVAVGALLSLTGANRKAQALQSVMNNLNIALDGMVRNIRMGINYHCGSGTGAPQDCTNGNTAFSFKPYCDPATCSVATESFWLYKFTCPVALSSDGSCSSGGYIQRSENGGSSWVRLTAPEVSIQKMTFYAIGTTPGDTIQPKVLVVVSGEAGAESAKTKTTFHIQATAVQRQLDLQ